MLRCFVEKLQKSLSALFVLRRLALDGLNQEKVKGGSLVPEDVMEGHFAVLAIKGEETKRFIVKLEYLSDPMFMELLDQAREEYGFKQKGALAVPCWPQQLKNILDSPRPNSTNAPG
ncbi:hypothetical protein RJT34_19778 [Clitoria ternatea]|uniref:Uncharacterized protein n=1 Tax=Clitoria ternatea TaxID=43366 RepID=A0AAN9IRQ1_CLITE